MIMPSGPGDLHSEARMALWRRARHTALCEPHASDGEGAILPPGVLEGPGFLYRPLQILVETGIMQTQPVENELVNRYGGSRDDKLSGRLAKAGLPIEVFTMPPEVYLPGLVARLRERPYGEWDAPAANVSVNTVFCGEAGSYHGGPYGEPASQNPFSETRYGTPAKGAPEIAVLDTGYDAQIATLHPGLKPRVAWQSGPGSPETILDGLYLAQEAGHGTFIEGIIMQLAPQMNISQVQVLTPDGATDDITVGLAIKALRNRAPVINLSLGGYTQGDTPPPNTNAAIAALPDTVVVVAAAGNNQSSEQFWPAACKPVVSVGALDTTQNPMRVAGFSNYGPWVDVYAPGVDVYSTYLDGNWKLPSDPASWYIDGYATWSGTSFAAPQVAAAIANTLLQSGGTARQAWNTVSNQTTWLPVTGLRGITGVHVHTPPSPGVIFPA